ncbi:MAG: N-acetylglucosamine-6-phosphate deacetylase [Myxococcota bacterium]
MSVQALWCERALTPEREIERVRLCVEEGRIVALEESCDPQWDDEIHRHGLLVPGLVDLQVNGGVGGAYDASDPAEHVRATAFHVQAGTTSLLATLVSAPLEHLTASLARLVSEVGPAGPLLGVHLEGPFLAEEKGGAHARAALRDPTPEAVEALIEAGGSTLRMVTLAPERRGALEAVERLAACGAIVAAGHTVARSARLREAIERGLSFVTHLGNASDWPGRVFDAERGYRVSEPGVVGSFLFERRLRGSLILDGHHLHPRLACALVELRGPESLALVSDATPAAGLPPGRYRHGGLDVEVRADGIATSGEGLAGSTIPLVGALRVAVRQGGIPLGDALRMATLTPAQILGVSDRKGRIGVGADADLLVLDEALEVRAVYRAGARIV